MSPLSRSIRPSFRRRPAFRSKTFRTQWHGLAVGTGTLAPDTAIHVALLASNQTIANYGQNQPTIIRIRGEILVTFTNADISTAESFAVVYIGIHVVDADDALPGGNPDDPVTNHYTSDWMYYRIVTLYNQLGATDARAAVAAAARFDVDVKSRRRLETGSTLVWSVVNGPVSAGAAPIGAAFTGRLLTHEFGR